MKKLETERRRQESRTEEVVRPEGAVPVPPEGRQYARSYFTPEDATGINPKNRRPIDPDSPFIPPA